MTGILASVGFSVLGLLGAVGGSPEALGAGILGVGVIQTWALRSIVELRASVARIEGELSRMKV